MDDGHHRFAGRFGVAVGDLHRDLFMIAEQHRRVILAIVHEGVVQPAKASAGIKCDIRKSILFDQIDDDIRLPSLGGFLDIDIFFLSRLCHLIVPPDLGLSLRAKALLFSWLPVLLAQNTRLVIPRTYPVKSLVTW